MKAPELLEIENLAINNYDYLEKIGEGGYGIVFKAKQVSTGQIVAIKTIKLKEALNKTKQQLARFERETKLCAEINHPNIVKLLDKGYLTNGQPYAVFEYIKGTTLKNFILQNNALSAPEMANLMGQVLDALACAHTKGIVHRDLKPSNIMVSKLGPKYHIKILDFGIAAFIHNYQSEHYQKLTITQDISGTPIYSAPEQLRGEIPTAKSDLYTWALLVIECLTGTPVINGTTLTEVVQQQLLPTNVPIPPAIISHQLGNLLRRVLEKDPRNRGGTAESIYKEFEQINFYTLAGNIAAYNQKNNHIDDVTIKNSMMWSAIQSTRKQLTILCLKLNIETTNDVQLDLETLDSIQKDQLNFCKDTATRYGGHVLGNFLNHLTVYFGYPTSSDTDARSIAITTIKLLTEIKKRNTQLVAQHGISLNIQIGLHTGTVLVHPNRIPEGSVPNIAFDLACKASPGKVLASTSSKKLLTPFLQFKKKHHHSAKNTLQTFELVEIQKTSSFLSPSYATDIMIGRIKEKKKLLNLWNAANHKGNAIIITGQVGIGKSKLAYELKKEATAVEKMVQISSCFPEHQNNALYPFFKILKNHWEIIDVEDNNILIKKIKSNLQQAGCTNKDSFPILCSWLSITLPKKYTISKATPEAQKKLLFHSLKKCLLQIDTKNVFLLIIENLHWADPVSIEFINYLLADIKNHHYLLIITARPILKKPWKQENLLQMHLQTLSKKNVQLLVENTLKSKLISNKAHNYIEQQSDGIPLFIVELTNMLLENKHIQLQNGVYELTQTINNIIPITLQDLLNAQLDRLTTAKDTLHIAAAIGRTFSYKLLVKSSTKEETAVQHDLNYLINAGLIISENKFPQEKYLFRYALMQQAVYQRMLDYQKKEVDKAIASVLAKEKVNI